MAEIPQHYNIDGIDDTMENIIKIVNHNAKTNKEAIYLFNTLKYLYRYGCKNGIKDLKKAEDYLSRLVKVKEEERSRKVEECFKISWKQNEDSKVDM